MTKYGLGPMAIAKTLSARERIRSTQFKLTTEIRLRSLSAPEAAYIAGFLDGEGSIQRICSTGKWRIDFTNTHEQVIDWIASRLGAGIKKSGLNKRYNGGSQPARYYRLYLYRTLEIHKLLKALLPYLIIKKALALATIDDIAARYPEVE